MIIGASAAGDGPVQKPEGSAQRLYAPLRTI